MGTPREASRADSRLPGRARPETSGVVAATLAVGAPLLRAALLAPRGSRRFRRRTVALATAWTAGGAAGTALAPHLWRVDDRDHLRDRVIVPLATAAGAVLVFSVGATVVATVPVLRREIETVLAHATQGSAVQAAVLALATGASEELFFRGTLHDAAVRAGLSPVPTTTALYTVTTCATGNPLLVAAAGILGAVTGRERARTGSLIAPTLVHLGWSLGMVTLLPLVVRRQHRRDGSPEESY